MLTLTHDIRFSLDGRRAIWRKFDDKDWFECCEVTWMESSSATRVAYIKTYGSVWDAACAEKWLAGETVELYT